VKINVEISGITPLLMNRFVEEDLMNNQKRDKSLTPRQQAEKSAYKLEDGSLFIPMENIFSCIIVAGKYHKDGKNKITTMKSSLVPAYVSIEEKYCPLNTKDFEVDSRSVVIPATGGRVMKHRPRLDKWGLKFTLEVDNKGFSERLVRDLVDDAGTKVGLGDFRPDRKGSFGKFKVTEWKVTK
jgi:hypothetical protein